MELLHWFALKEIPGIGNLTFRRLMEVFDSPSAVFDASPDQLIQVRGISRRLAHAIVEHTPSKACQESLSRALESGIAILTLNDKNYPRLLLEIPDPPPILQVAGHLPKENNAIAIVGSRRATSYGMTHAKNLARDLAGSGYTIISGLARGIDTAAHQGALSAGGKTIAVLGSGLGTIYPSENTRLAHTIAENGAVISEWPMETPPEAHHFPLRNRIISGLSLGVVVVEASLKSGSLITARCAAEQNREVFALPGHVKASQSSGTHRLIQEGAKLITSPSDITDELTALTQIFDKDNEIQPDINTLQPKTSQHTESSTHFPLDPDESCVLKVLDLYPSHIDDILKHVPMDAGQLSATLLKLELKGVVERSPGKLFSLKEEKP